MALPIQRPEVLEYLKEVSEKYVQPQTAATMTVELHWRNGSFAPEVSVQVRLPRRRIEK